MTSDNDKENEPPSGISGVSGPREINHKAVAKSLRTLGSSGLTWPHQAKPVSVLGAGAALAGEREQLQRADLVFLAVGRELGL